MDIANTWDGVAHDAEVGDGLWTCRLCGDVCGTESAARWHHARQHLYTAFHDLDSPARCGSVTATALYFDDPNAFSAWASTLCPGSGASWRGSGWYVLVEVQSGDDDSGHEHSVETVGDYARHLADAARTASGYA